MDMLSLAVQRIESLGFRVVHADVTVIAEQPTIVPHRPAMRAALSRVLHISPEAINVKGKTNEGMGWIGRGEGLACIAVATLAELAR
jgi:2-C-methyl-D-erythritol 2,4-cyclodiphosphate synthase